MSGGPSGTKAGPPAVVDSANNVCLRRACARSPPARASARRRLRTASRTVVDRCRHVAVGVAADDEPDPPALSDRETKGHALVVRANLRQCAGPPNERPAFGHCSWSDCKLVTNGRRRALSRARICRSRFSSMGPRVSPPPVRAANRADERFAAGMSSSATLRRDSYSRHGGVGDSHLASRCLQRPAPECRRRARARRFRGAAAAGPVAAMGVRASP